MDEGDKEDVDVKRDIDDVEAEEDKTLVLVDVKVQLLGVVVGTNGAEEPESCVEPIEEGPTGERTLPVAAVETVELCTVELTMEGPSGDRRLPVVAVDIVEAIGEVVGSDESEVSSLDTADREGSIIPELETILVELV